MVAKWLWYTGTLEYGLWNDTGAGQRCYRLSVRVVLVREGIKYLDVMNAISGLERRSLDGWGLVDFLV